MANILLVDDSKLLCDLLGHCLRSAGYEVTIANGGLAGWKLVSSAKPDLILLDVQMPDLDGLSFLQMLRSLPEGAKVPVIILTADEQSQTVMKAGRLGAKQYILKNHCLVQEVLERVKNLLSAAVAVPA